MILVLGGTTEARMLLEHLIDRDLPAIVSTAYKFADRFVPQSANITHISGKLDASQLQALIEEQRITLVIDATHPYAEGASENAREACAATGARYVRAERDASTTAGELPHLVETPEQAAALACDLGDTIFVTAGSNYAETYAREARTRAKRIYIRVLPEDSSLERCREAGFSEDEIITGVGPFSYEDNVKQWRGREVDVVITKESGGSGGFPEKLNAARDLAIQLVVIARPKYSQEYSRTVQEIFDLIDELA